MTDANVCFPPIADIGGQRDYRLMTRPRVFFDTNDGSMEQGYWLGFEQSRNDLGALGGALRPGTIVTIYMPDELEMAATLRFDDTEKVWWADPVGDTVTYLDGSA